MFKAIFTFKDRYRDLVGGTGRFVIGSNISISLSESCGSVVSVVVSSDFSILSSLSGSVITVGDSQSPAVLISSQVLSLKNSPLRMSHSALVVSETQEALSPKIIQQAPLSCTSNWISSRV